MLFCHPLVILDDTFSLTYSLDGVCVCVLELGYLMYIDNLYFYLTYEEIAFHLCLLVQLNY